MSTTKNMSKRRTKASANNTCMTRQQVQQMLLARQEVKRFIGVTSTTTVTAGVVTLISAIAQGDTVTTRTGDKIKLVHIDYNFVVTDVQTSIVRLMIFQDNTNQGVAPAVTEVLSSASTVAHLNATNDLQHRFKIHVDRLVSLSVAGELAKTLRGVRKTTAPVYFTGTGGTSFDNSKGAVYALIIGSNTSSGYTLNVELQYTDS